MPSWTHIHPKHVETALNTNIIPHIWKLSVVHIPKHTHETRVQNTTLYTDSTTHSKQHCRQMGSTKCPPPPCVNNHCSTRYDQSFRNNKYTHTYQKAAAAQGTGHIKFMANYIKGRNAYTTYRNHASSQRQFKTGVP